MKTCKYYNPDDFKPKNVALINFRKKYLKNPQHVVTMTDKSSTTHTY